MSFRLGAKAFIERFQKKFPEPTFTWKVNGGKKMSSLSEDKLFIVVSKGNEEVIRLRVTTDYGCYISLYSLYLNNTHYRVLKNRPLHPYIFGNQYNKRTWLKDKPKYAMMACKWACQIENNFAKAQEAK